MPANAKLEVAANILGSDIGFVKPGQNATIKLNTFQYTEYGTGEGTVRSISPDAFTTPQGVGPNNQAGGIAATGTTAGAPVTSVSTTSNGIANSLSAGLNSASYYETRVSVDRLNLHGVPPNFRLIPGLPVVVDVKVGTNTILQYLMNRVLPIFDQAMREP
jgi:HlyD family secretion protein